jgi:hypothetical protein
LRRGNRSKSRSRSRSRRRSRSRDRGERRERDKDWDREDRRGDRRWALRVAWSGQQGVGMEHTCAACMQGLVSILPWCQHEWVFLRAQQVLHSWPWCWFMAAGCQSSAALSWVNLQTA